MSFRSDRLRISDSGKRWYNVTKKELNVWIVDHWHNFGDVPQDYKFNSDEIECFPACGNNARNENVNNMYKEESK